MDMVQLEQLWRAAKEMGASTGKLLRYATSGDVIGDTASVVGYSSIAFV